MALIEAATRDYHTGRGSALDEWQAASNIVGQLVGWEKDSIIQTGLVEGLDQRGFPQIRMENGQIYTHVAGDLIQYDRMQS